MDVTPKRRVIAVALAIIAAVAVTACASPASSTGTGIQAAQVSPAVAKLVAEVTDIPFAASDGNWAAAPIFQASTLDGPALTKGGRPEVLYVSTEYCPYCATEDWALLIALGRFGTFTGVNEIRSAIYPPIPPIDTWTFYRSSYTSNYLAFVPVETYSNVLVNPTASPLRATSYRVLQKLTPAQRAVFDKIDKQHVTPLTDLGGKTELIGSPFSPSPLEHLTWSQLVTALRAHRGTAAEQIIGAADAITAELCVLTGNKPASACPPEIKDFIVFFQ
jgi:Domain of unknown function (DUF929)